MMPGRIIPGMAASRSIPWDGLCQNPGVPASHVSCARGMSDELTRHMSDLCVWMISERREAPDAAQSGIDGGDTDGAL